MRVREEFSGMRLIDFLLAYHPPTPLANWLAWLDRGDIELHAKPAHAEQIVAAGERYVQTMHDIVEPDVRAEIKILYEDEALLVVDKPAPLPVHPSGRFNRNTLSKMLESVYPGEKLRLAHRLDANTTGIVVICRTAEAAASVQSQFDKREVTKEYIARVHGHVNWDEHCCELPIGRSAELTDARNTRGSRITHPQGQAATTRFRVLERLSDHTSRVQAIPITGRTNQIRVHLWSLSFPIVGDPLYLPNQTLGTQQTLNVDQPPMCLHAATLTFLHPMTLKPITLTSTPSWC
jgi:RluA family pseudouridine synthase